MKINVSNIPAKLEEAELTRLFVQYGQVSHLKIERDRQTGDRKNTCSLEMRVTEQAIKAIDNLNGLTILGNKLLVSADQS